MLLRLVQSDCERECIKYAIFRASGMTATKSRCRYGLECMNDLEARVEQAIKVVQRTHETVEDIASIQDRSLLATFGIQQKLYF